MSGLVSALMHEYSAKSGIKNAADKSRTILRSARQNKNQMMVGTVFQPIKNSGKLVGIVEIILDEAKFLQGVKLILVKWRFS